MQEADSEKIAAALAIVHQARERVEALSDAMAGGGTGISLRAVAERLYSDRRRRDEHFPPGLFGEPAWDLLLALYIAREEGKDLHIAQAFDSAFIEPEAGRDLVRRMESEGLVAAGSRDSIRLTESAAERLTDYLSRLV